MSQKAKRAVTAGCTVLVAALVNVATGMLTKEWAAAWWAAVAVLVLLGGALQAWLTVAERPQRPQGTQRIHNTKVGGSAQQAMTRPGEQNVTGSEIGNSLTQRQDDSP